MKTRIHRFDHTDVERIRDLCAEAKELRRLSDELCESLAKQLELSRTRHRNYGPTRPALRRPPRLRGHLQAMKAYLDNNVVSAIAKDDTQGESDALDKLLAAMDEGKIDLVTSGLSLAEIQKQQGPNRRLTERTFRLLAKVPTVPWDRLYGIHSYGNARTWISAPQIERDQLYDSLLSLGLEELDAQHVFVAVRTDCEACLTCDRGVLNLAQQIRQLAATTIQKPSVFVANQGW